MNECKGKCNKFAFCRYLIRMRKNKNSTNREFHSNRSGGSRLIYLFFGLLLFSMVFIGCSTKEDGVAYRVYHNTLGRYNGYFNANELVKKSQTTLANGRKDDYDEVIPLYYYGTVVIHLGLWVFLLRKI